MTFTHDFDILFSLESDKEDFNEVPASEIRKRVLDTINNMDDQDLLERVCHADSFPNDDEGDEEAYGYYHVWYINPDEGDERQCFGCWADGADHAEEQCLDAEPNATIVDTSFIND